jgi:hypothetical protein
MKILLAKLDDGIGRAKEMFQQDTYSEKSKKYEEYVKAGLFMKLIEQARLRSKKNYLRLNVNVIYQNLRHGGPSIMAKILDTT